MPFDPAIEWSIGAAWLTFLLYWLVRSFGVKRTVKRQSLVSRVAQIGGGGVVIFLLFDGRVRWAWLTSRFIPPGFAWAAAGAAITWAGVALAIWARTILGANWSGTVTLKEGHTLIRDGPYAVVRHPIYSGLLLAALGTAVALNQIRGLLAVVAAFLILVSKYRIEERFMTERFGSEYEAYRRHTRALIPFVF